MDSQNEGSNREYVKSIDDINRLENEEHEMHEKIISEIITRRDALGKTVTSLK